MLKSVIPTAPGGGSSPSDYADTGLGILDDRSGLNVPEGLPPVVDSGVLKPLGGEDPWPDSFLDDMMNETGGWASGMGDEHWAVRGL